MFETNITGRLIATGLLLVACILLMLDPIYPDEQLLQMAHTPIMLALLIWWRKAQWLSNTGYYCLITFLLLHAIGARWIYSFVPYEPLIGDLGYDRNMYDRFVHFFYGVLLYLPLRDLLRSRFNYPGRTSFYVSVLWINASGVFYELFEWGLAMGMNPEQAEAYNGQQGDMWDAHKDMALAAGGALIPMLADVIRYKR